MSEKKELSLDELENVTGGKNWKKNCIYFVKASTKPAVKRCVNCFYYNKNELGFYTCTHSARNDDDNKESGVI